MIYDSKTLAIVTVATDDEFERMGFCGPNVVMFAAKSREEIDAEIARLGLVDPSAPPLAPAAELAAANNLIDALRQLAVAAGVTEEQIGAKSAELQAAAISVKPTPVGPVKGLDFRW
jgi:hypothetical protein